MQNKILAIVVNWNQPELTSSLVCKLKKQSSLVDIFLVDNNSTDRSLEILSSLDVFFHRSTYNGGFGYGCNIGIDFAIENFYEYVWLINNDVDIFDNELSEKLINYCSARDDRILVGLNILDLKHITPTHAGFVMKPFSFRIYGTSNEQALSSEQYAWLNAASLFVPTKIFQKIGKFDTDFFMYWEDVDLCCRARKFGYGLGVLEDGFVYHTAGTSSAKMITKRYVWSMQSGYKWISKNAQCKSYAYVVFFLKNLLNSLRFRSFQMLVATFGFR